MVERQDENKAIRSNFQSLIIPNLPYLTYLKFLIHYQMAASFICSFIIFQVQLDRAIVKSLSSKQEETESSVDYGFQSRGSSPSSLGAAQTAQQTKLTPVADLIAQAREALEERMVHTAPFALYKTEICKYFKSNVPGSCVNGEKVPFKKLLDHINLETNLFSAHLHMGRASNKNCNLDLIK